MTKMKMDNKRLLNCIERKVEDLGKWTPGYWAEGFFYDLGILEGLLMAYGQDDFVNVKKLKDRWSDGDDSTPSLTFKAVA